LNAEKKPIIATQDTPQKIAMVRFPKAPRPGRPDALTESTNTVNAPSMEIRTEAIEMKNTLFFPLLLFG
jgi:hypothetical protein